MTGGDRSYRPLPPGSWCTRCGGRPGIAGPLWICRVWVAGGPRRRCIRNDGRRPLPPGTPLARAKYRAAGLCVQCGRDRDRDDRQCCARCRRRLASASNRFPARTSASRTAAAPGLSCRPAPPEDRRRAVHRVQRRAGPGRPAPARTLLAPGSRQPASAPAPPSIRRHGRRGCAVECFHGPGSGSRRVLKWPPKLTLTR